MSYFKCFKSDFREFASIFIILLFILHVAVGSKIGSKYKKQKHVKK